MSAIKPPGYWDDFANVECELRAFIAQRGDALTMPNYVELKRSGYATLSYAISRNGAFEAVAERLGLEWTHTRKPQGFWADFSNLERELRVFVAQHGQLGIMPTSKQLLAVHRSDLVKVIYRCGGSRAVAERMGLKAQGRGRSTNRQR